MPLILRERKSNKNIISKPKLFRFHFCLLCCCFSYRQQILKEKRPKKELTACGVCAWVIPAFISFLESREFSQVWLNFVFNDISLIF